MEKADTCKANCRTAHYPVDRTSGEQVATLITDTPIATPGAEGATPGRGASRRIRYLDRDGRTWASADEESRAGWLRFPYSSRGVASGITGRSVRCSDSEVGSYAVSCPELRACASASDTEKRDSREHS